ncbi:hypothetical protein H0H81_006642 [Sphagnurus paluster]|uniref:HCNGP-domain-containing protein n=1 Tax=Sphagnurus paluster TaxID=117069 RepID=A0A9P7FR81_9AGAR|nr:hypothetical protein H0H81_006642 [Sphagnurus paluster]
MHARRLQKSQVIIKRPPPALKKQTRAHIFDDISQDAKSSQPERRSSASPMELDTPPPESEPRAELARIRALLHPPVIPGIDEDWGIPPASTDPPDPALVTKLAQFHTLKRDPDNPRHFNDSLMSNRSFRNPHLYTKLVEFVDVDERTTNFPKDIWDPDDVRPEWFADRLGPKADHQKARSEQQEAAQASGKRSQISFSSSSASKGKERETGSAGTALGRKSRFQPYVHGSDAPGVNMGAGKKDWEGGRWR